MDLLALRTRLRRAAGNPSVDAVTDAQLDEHLNDAYRDIANKYRFHALRKLCTFDTVASTSKYGLPTDLNVVLRVRDQTSDKKLRKFGDRRMAERTAIATEGAPTHYARYRSFIELDPTPDDVYTIEIFYKSVIALMASDPDVPVLPEPWHEGIVKMARFKYFEDQVDLPKAKAAFDLWQAWQHDMPIEVDEETADMDSGVSVGLEDTLVPSLDFDHSE